jgi:mono/diheme cytochrome c family protein
MSRTILPSLLLSFSVALACSKRSDAPPSASPSGPATDAAAAPASFDAQVARGKELYGANCASCHGADGSGGKGPKVVGEGALTRFANAAEVFSYVSENMPGNAPGSLPEDEVVAILAFDLFANGVKLDEPLSTSNAAAIELGGG